MDRTERAEKRFLRTEVEIALLIKRNEDIRRELHVTCNYESERLTYNIDDMYEKDRNSGNRKKTFQIYSRE
jgi:flagellin-specific chaperone FliS